MNSKKHLISGSGLIFVIISCLMTSSCASVEAPSYIKQYQVTQKIEALKPVPSHALDGFADLFSNLHSDQLAQKVEAVYAETLYFNDTLNTIESRDELLKYFKHTADNLENYQFSISDVAYSKDNVYVRWVMDVQFTAAGKSINSRSVGMSHLKFDNQGQIILHQDFWDSVEGIYQHLPYVGYLFRKVRDKL